MKKRVVICILAVLLALFVANVAFAGQGDPIGGCPKKFHLHDADHHHEEEHHHAGTYDHNDDGWICVRHVTETTHVHVDNNKPLP